MNFQRIVEDKHPFNLQKLRTISLFSLAIFFAVSSSWGQEDIRTEQVSFEKGKSGATIEGSITGSEIIDYKLNARSGQAMNVSMATDNTANYFNVMEPGEQYVAVFNGSVGENMYEGTLEKSGDYTIRVYLMRSAARRNEKANFRLEISIAGSAKSGSSGDALVQGTNYHATGQVPCQIGGNGQSTGNCDFGVVREGNGTGMVTITKPDGKKRTIFFENGKAIRYDQSQADHGEFKAFQNQDLNIIHIGDERYEVPDAVINGG